MVEYDLNSKYPGEYSTFDKLGRGAKAKRSKVSELTRYVFQHIWSNSWNSTVKQIRCFIADSLCCTYLIPRFSQLLRAFAEKSEVGLHFVRTWDINHFLSTTRPVSDMLRKAKFKSVFKHNKPLALRGDVTNASLKQWLGILHPKFERKRI